MTGSLINVAGDSARGALSLFLGDFASTAMLAFGYILIARFLGPEGYGLYSLSLVAPTILASLIGLGLDSAVLRFSAKYKAEKKYSMVLSTLNLVLTFKLIVGMLGSLGCFLFSELLAIQLLNRPEIAHYIRIISLAVLLQTFFTFIYNSLVGLDSAEKASGIKALMSMVKACSAPILIILGLGVTGAILGHVLGYVVACLVGLSAIYFSHYKKLKSASKITCDKDGSNHVNRIKLMLGYGLPLYFSSLLFTFQSQLQLILLANYVSDFEIGSFKAAANISSTMTVLIGPITTALFPAFSKIESINKKEELENFFNLSIKYSSLIMLPLTILVMALSNELVGLIYGQRYSLSAIYLAFQVSTFLLTAIGYQIIESLFNGVGETSLTLKIYIASLIVFLPLSMFLTQRYRVVGIIVAQIVSSIILTLYGINLIAKRLKMNFNLKNQPKIIATSILSTLPVIAFLKISPLAEMFNLVLCTLMYLATYLTLIPALKAINLHELQNVEQIFGRIKILTPITKLIVRYEIKILTILQVKHAEDGRSGLKSESSNKVLI